MEPIFLSRVETTFAIKGRGIVVLPGVPYEPNTHRVSIGDVLEIRRTDGSTSVTKVSGLELGGPPGKNACPIVLPAELRVEEVPVGSEVWQLSRKSPQT